MKRIIDYIFVLFGMLVLTCCSDTTTFVEGSWNPSLHAKYVSLETTNVNFTAVNDLSRAINIKALNTSWRINGTCSWVTFSQMEGNADVSVNVTVDQNTDPRTSRTAIFAFESIDEDFPYTKNIVIMQAPAEYTLDLSESTINATAGSSSHTVVINSNAGWEFSVLSDWIHCTRDGDSLVFRLDENTTEFDADRIGYVEVRNEKLTRMIIVNQQPPGITSASDEIRFGPEGGEHQQIVTSDVSWTAKTSAYFITAVPENNIAGQSTLNISATVNRSEYDRTGNVYLNIGSKTKIMIPVHQSRVICNVSTNNIDFTSLSGTKTFNIESNCEWNIASCPTWIKIDKQSGNGNAIVQVSVEENNTTDVLEGDIVINDANQVVTKTIHLTQSGKHAYVEIKKLEFSHRAEQKNLSFDTDGAWTASVDADWVTLDSNTGTGSHTITVSVKENFTSSSRQANITLMIAGTTHIVTVTQESKYLVLPSSAFSFDASSGYAYIYISSNTHWTATVKDKPNWLIVTPTSGDNDANITIGVSENKTSEERHGQVVVSIPDFKDYIINVTQTGKTIKVDKSYVEFSLAGGTVVINVTTDGEYAVTKSGNWFGYTKNGNAISVIAPQNNSGAKREGKLVFTLCGNTSGSYFIEVPIVQL